jgi:hypothetical protein
LNTKPEPNFGDRGVYTCVPLTAGSISPSINAAGTSINNVAVTRTSLVFLCDGRGSAGGAGNIDQNGVVR